jgi:DNA-binding NtrC family response regulator
MPEQCNHAGIAIVDDDVQLVRTYELLFKHKHVQVSFVAYDGLEAIKELRKAEPKPRVIIIDYRMEPMSGLDLMKEVLTIEPSIKIIFVSGDDSIQQESVDAGAAAFLKKPTGIKTITDTVTHLINP